ncbi:hypothetical protein B0H19DRAFT_1374114 [Mycena capillaripes]|nr:hypothetical protein B0H19DRAFT_1374114 [Mycena capillaripes]
MQVDQLNPDVLLDILAFTDVFTSPSLSRVNRTLHKIGASKQLWISIVFYLSSRRLIYLPSEVNSEYLSALALMDEVKRIVVGPRTWSFNSPDPPTLLRQRTISLEGNEVPDLSHPMAGQYIITCVPQSAGTNAYLDTTPHFLEVPSGRHVWS